ncbi:MAG: DUF2399 domain-containing protein [Firmicutes bacterium]|nr:DUF2399 domain-containing protein [Bacillota bacterium]
MIYLEFAEYLRQEGFERFLDAWLKKYKSLGQMGGKIHLKNLSKIEKERLSAFLSLPLEDELSITYTQMQRRLQGTKFEEVDFAQVLKILYGDILSNKEKRELQEKKIEEHKKALLNQVMGLKSYEWLKELLDLYREFPCSKENLLIVSKALDTLPCFSETYETLPVFATRVSGNPHYFDKGIQRELLLKGIEYEFHILEKSRDLEHITELFQIAGLLKDDISNYCCVCHVLPENSKKWKYFYEEYEPWNVNLYNVINENSIFHRSDILIIENPSVFRYLSLKIKQEKRNLGLICSNGQINTCTYLLLDRLYNSGCTLYYCGDFDPEGLLIAQKLKDRYENLNLFCYEEDYLREYGTIQKAISNKRIEILNNLEESILVDIGEFIKENTVFCFQEALIEAYEREVENF